MVWLDFELDSWMERYRAEFHTCVRCELKQFRIHGVNQALPSASTYLGLMIGIGCMHSFWGRHCKRQWQHDACVSVLTWLGQQKAPMWQLGHVSCYLIPHNPETEDLDHWTRDVYIDVQHFDLVYWTLIWFDFDLIRFIWFDLIWFDFDLICFDLIWFKRAKVLRQRILLQLPACFN